MKLNEKIKSLRLSKGLTLEGLGNMLGLSRANMHHWESGRSKPSSKNLKALADALKVPLSELVSDENVVYVLIFGKGKNQECMVFNSLAKAKSMQESLGKGTIFEKGVQ